MEEFLVILLQFAFELVLEVLVNIPFDWLYRRQATSGSDFSLNPHVLWFVVGCLVAVASLLVLPHTLIAVSALRVANLVLAPLASALLSETLAARRAGDNASWVPRQHYWRAFWFTLGLVLVRFAFASHP